MAEEHVTRLSVMYLEKRLQSMNDLDVYPRSSQLLLLNGRVAYHFLFVNCCFNVFISDRFQDITTFEVNVTSENSFIFDDEA